jgi:hypothetical protein
MIHNTIKKIKNLRMAIYIAQANHVCNMIFCFSIPGVYIKPALPFYPIITGVFHTKQEGGLIQ